MLHRMSGSHNNSNRSSVRAPRTQDSRGLNGLKRGEAIIGLILNYLSVAAYAILILGGGALIAGIGFGLG